MATKTNNAIKISQKHLLGIQDLSINDVNIIPKPGKKIQEEYCIKTKRESKN